MQIQTLSVLENTLSDCKTSWETMKPTTEIAKDPNQPKIIGEKWFNHFSNLHSEKCKKSLPQKQVAS